MKKELYAYTTLLSWVMVENLVKNVLGLLYSPDDYKKASIYSLQLSHHHMSRSPLPLLLELWVFVSLFWINT